MKERRQFGLLMWKHLQLRKNRWFITLVEIFLPIALGYLFCSNASRVYGRSTPEKAFVEPIYKVSKFLDNSRDITLLYAPKNKFTEQLMDRAVTYGNLPHVQGFSDEDALMKVLVNKTSDYSYHRNGGWMGVVFLNTENNDTKPAKVTYKVRSVNKWSTQELFSENTVPGPVRGDPYFYQGFAGVQMIIDTAFIRQWNSSFSFNDIEFQAFPYPEYQAMLELQSLVPTFVYGIVILTTFLLSFPLISAIIEEKESGIKELMKLAGVSEWLIQSSWFLNAIIFSIFSFTIVTFFLQYKFEDPFFNTSAALFMTVPVSLIWTCIILYCISNIAFCFTFTAVFHSTTVATSVFTMIYIALGYGATKIPAVNSLFLLKIMCLFPIVAISQGFQRMGYFENHKINITWTALNEAEDESKGVSLMFVYMMLIFDTILYLLLTYYISSINPGSFGSKKSPLFFLQNLNFPRQMLLWLLKMLWPSSHANQAEELIDMDDGEDSKYFEDPPKALEVSIQIKDLYKKFGSFVAVRGLNLKVFKGEITALLGHNGAGKTTTMSILTGMLKPNVGSITYDKRMDVLSEMSEFRQYLGMCPQEDRLFPYLTVADHLWFFGMLKGGASSEVVKKEADSYLRLMELQDKKNDLSRSLSGGMKRKLCLAISLMGNSQILILDEPTSGMDVESRRKIWDLLLELRGTRTIILSTHYMEEADVLGDRIAIMADGNVVCHGTTMFLKKVYGTGYKLTIVKEPGESRLTNIITKSVPNAEKVTESDTEVIFNLPLTDSANFPGLFRILESEKSSLGIQNMGVTCTTMEQVFLKVGGASIYDVGRKRSSTVTDGNLLSEHSKNKKTGLSLIFQQLKALLWKKILFTQRNVIHFCYRVVLYSLFIVALLYSADAIVKDDLPISLSISLYPNEKVMLTKSQGDLYNGFLNLVEKSGDTVIYSNNSDIVNDLLDYGRHSLNSYQRELLLAANFQPSNSTVLYNKFATHSLPVLINSISNVLLGLIAGTNSSIEAINSPVKDSDRICKFGEKESVAIITWFIALVFFTIDLTYFYATFLSTERIDGFKHIQFMSNLSSLMYWFSNWIFDFLFFLFIVILRIMAIKIVADSGGFLTFNLPYYIFLLLLCGYIMSGLLFSYVVNFISRSKEGSYLLLFLFTTIGIIVSVVLFVVGYAFGDPDTLTGWTLVYYLVKFIVLLVPPLNYSLAFIKFAFIWYQNALASKPGCSDVSGEQSALEYLVFASAENRNGLLLEVYFIMVNVILYSFLLWVIEAGYMGQLFNRFVIKQYAEERRETTAEPDDPDVEMERRKVELQSQQLAENVELKKRHSDVEKGLDSDSDALETVPLNRASTRNSVVIAQGLKKVFLSKTLKPFVAVEDVNFAVSSGECFGLLGVNGAGKSTTFKMLTAIELPTKGESYIHNIKLSSSKTMYLSKAGYCAQTNCFIEELTGREMLQLIASLRGVRSEKRKLIVDKWLSILGLESYQNRRCGRYSGGNKRKLCTAMSLIGDPSVVFLDEPTTGVDPVSRCKLYDVMDHSKLSGQAVVLTSHSMEECENLCDRLTIMSKGRMKCIGTAQHLKQRYAQGFSILIKTRDVPVEAERGLIETLKNNLETAFGRNFCVLKDEHKGLLYYQITNVQLKWSELFEKLENLKQNNAAIVEDYTVSDTTLEEVFISFAKQE